MSDVQPSRHLYMEFEVAMCRLEALFSAITEMARKPEEDAIYQLAGLGIDIVKDQLALYEQEQVAERKAKKQEAGQ